MLFQIVLQLRSANGAWTDNDSAVVATQYFEAKDMHEALEKAKELDLQGPLLREDITMKDAIHDL